MANPQLKERKTEPTLANTSSTTVPQKDALRQVLLAAAVLLVLASVGLALALYARGCGQYDVYSSAFATIASNCSRCCPRCCHT